MDNINNEKCYCVYLHKNLINGKRYYGITSEKVPELRWKKGYQHNKHLTSAFKKYGWNNFSHEIIKQNLTKNEAEHLEVKLIKKYKTNDSKYGYNKTSGGGAGVFRHSESSKKMMSEHTKGELNPMYGKHHDNSTVEKIKTNLINHPNTSKKILCIETNTIYLSVREAARQTGIKYQSIQQAVSLNGNQQKAGGFHWVYIDVDNLKNAINNSLTPRKNSLKPVIQYDKNKQFIKNWNSAIDAANFFNKSVYGITSCCNHKQKTAYGYIWEYKDDYECLLKEGEKNAFKKLKNNNL